MWSRISAVFAITASLSLFSGCGGGGSAGGDGAGPNAPSATYSASSGVAQKGPLQQGSTVTAQTLDANLAPTGQQFTYQIVTNLGAFSPTAAFSSRYVGLNASGYYFDEVTGGTSGGTITLNGYNDLAVDSTVNVNLLTTLAYQRIQALVRGGKTFAEARVQAEREVLAAFALPSTVVNGSFSTLDLSKGTQGSEVLAALSALLSYGNTSGTLSSLIAGMQSDLAQNGAITDQTTLAVLRASAAALDVSSVAANLTQAYASLGLTFSPADIGDWIDRDADGVVGHFEFQVPDATQTTSFVLPSVAIDPYAGTPLTISSGGLAVNGTPGSGPTSVQRGDTVSVSPPAGTFPNGVSTIYLLSAGKKIGRVSFVSGLQSLTVAPIASVPIGLTQQMSVVGSFTDGSTADMTSSVEWTSNAPSIASIDGASGVATAASLGTATVTAASGSVTGSAVLTVIPAVLVSMNVTPNPLQAGVGVTRPAIARATYSDGRVSALAGSVTWSTQSPSVASVSGGLVTGVALGSTTLTASVGSLSASAPIEVATDIWVRGADLPIPKRQHSATLLPSGRVLVIGGNTPLIYDPTSDSWSAAAAPPAGRTSHTATLMSDGRVLVAGGRNDQGDYATQVYIYDPISNAWGIAGNGYVERTGHTVTPLASGKLLLACGAGKKADLYDPVSNTWTPAADMNIARSYCTATALPSGQVLVAGGSSGRSAEIYDPTSGTWTMVNIMSTSRVQARAVLLADGKVLVAGGDGFATSRTAELFDPVTGSWSDTGSMSAGRMAFTLTLLPDGKVLATGGADACLNSTEVYDPVGGGWSFASSMLNARDSHTATLLPTGTTLVVGGNANCSGTATSSTELYW